MEEAEASPAEEAPETTAPAPAPHQDWSDLRGFQLIIEPAGLVDADRETFAVELAKEIAARAARFAQSVDDSIVLASDGLFRWLGDPVARLVGGDDILKPRAILLAHEALAGESREAVEHRLALWVTAHIRKVLGPLEALSEPGTVTEPVRELGQRIVQALGVLDRERVRQQVKNLDQGARSALRKLGVRFGAFYIYVPALLKPGARMLCSQLWSLRRGVEPGSERLLAFAASGRTSFAAEAPLSPDTYRVAGFRLCGDRVVRVDIVERLTDLIRAAIPDHMRPTSRPPSDAYGFVVTPQMTSLTGCAGESFASILRSLGFESHQVKKSEHATATRKAPTAPIAQPTAPALVGEGEAAPPDEAAAGAEDAVESATQSDGGETIVAAEADHEPTLAEDAGELSPESEAGETIAAAEPFHEPEASADGGESAAESDIVATAQGHHEPAMAEEAADPAAALTEETESLATGEAADAVSTHDGAQAESEAEHPVGEAVDASAESTTALVEEAPADEEMVEIWRPAPRRRPQPTPRPRAEDGEAAQRPHRDHRDQRRRFTRDRDAAPPAEVVASAAPAAPAAEAPPPRESRRPEGGRSFGGEGRRPRPFKGPRPEEGRGAAEAPRGGREPPPPKKEPRPQTVDMDSPFAKLLALKPLLERRDKRT